MPTETGPTNATAAFRASSSPSGMSVNPESLPALFSAVYRHGPFYSNIKVKHIKVWLKQRYLAAPAVKGSELLREESTTPVSEISERTSEMLPKYPNGAIKIVHNDLKYAIFLSDPWVQTFPSYG